MPLIAFDRSQPHLTRRRIALGSTDESMKSESTGQSQGKRSDEVKPLTVTVAKACELSGFGPTSIWAFLKDGRLEAVRVPGIRRTLISYDSLLKLLVASADVSPPSRRRRPRKIEHA